MSTTPQSELPAAGRWIGISGRLVIALMKGVVAVMAGSKALLVDSLRMVADCVPLVAASKQQYRLLGKIALAILYIVIGLEVGVNAVKDLFAGVEEAPHPTALAAVAAAFILQRYALPLRERLLATVCSCILLVGLGGALLGALLSISALFYLDAVAAIILSGVLIVAGCQEAVRAGQPPETDFKIDKLQDELRQFLNRIDGVVAVRTVLAWEEQEDFVVHAVISVNPRISVAEGRSIASRAKWLMTKRFERLSAATIAVEPYDPGVPYKSNVDPAADAAPMMLQ